MINNIVVEPCWSYFFKIYRMRAVTSVVGVWNEIQNISNIYRRRKLCNHRKAQFICDQEKIFCIANILHKPYVSMLNTNQSISVGDHLPALMTRGKSYVRSWNSIFFFYVVTNSPMINWKHTFPWKVQKNNPSHFSRRNTVSTRQITCSRFHEHKKFVDAKRFTVQ